MKNKLLNNSAGIPLNSEAVNPFKFYYGKTKIFFAFVVIFVLLVGLLLPLSPTNKTSILPHAFSVIPTAKANSVYYNLSSGALSLNITPTSTDQITTNDDWSGIPSVEGYFGKNLTATHGVDPQTVLGTEFTNNALSPAGDTQVNANKGNPSAYNAGGVTEFDSGTPLGIGFQGNVQANPYLVFYLNTMGRSNITMSYTVTDLDSGSNNSISPLAVQYRVGETGNFINISEAFIADATDGPNLGGRVTTIDITLPAVVDNKPKVQIRLITTNAANGSGSSTPDEWIGINNVVIGQLSPTAATVSLSGRVTNAYGRGISKAKIRMTDSAGAVRTTNTSSFGYYNFADVESGQTLFLEVSHKSYNFSEPTRVISLMEELATVDFIAY
jgi:hypothetical protein